MKKVLLLAALVLGTSVMVNAQEKPKATAPAKEVKTTKKTKKMEKVAKKDSKMDAAPAAAKK
jgi:hypothetical protein